MKVSLAILWVVLAVGCGSQRAEMTLAGGQPVQVLAGACTSVVAAGQSMYVTTQTGIMRIRQE